MREGLDRADALCVPPSFHVFLEQVVDELPEFRPVVDEQMRLCEGEVYTVAGSGLAFVHPGWAAKAQCVVARLTPCSVWIIAEKTS
jgi:hypothetical protein